MVYFSFPSQCNLGECRGLVHAVIQGLRPLPICGSKIIYTILRCICPQPTYGPWMREDRKHERFCHHPRSSKHPFCPRFWARAHLSSCWEAGKGSLSAPKNKGKSCPVSIAGYERRETRVKNDYFQAWELED